MQSSANSVQEYLDALPQERKKPMEKLRKITLENLPNGFSEEMAYGMLAYVVPHTIYPEGYHCNPEQALPFINIASQKNHIALYHMGLYANKDLLEWFIQAYPEHSKRKLDMGKSCIRFKNMDDIPYALIGQLAAKMSPQQWISTYENEIKR